MARTRTLLVDIRKLHGQGGEAAVMLRLMMACNDLTTANRILGMCNEDTREKTDYLRRGDAMYFIRLQLSHLHEALKVVSEIQDYSELLKLIDNCPGGTDDDYARLLSFANGGANAEDFRKYVEVVRHTVTFHYGQRIVEKALRDRAGRRGETAHRLTIADDVRRLRFQVADDVVNTLVCHQIWGIVPNGDTATEADRILEFGFEIFKTFVNFTGTLVTRYVEKHAAFTR